VGYGYIRAAGSGGPGNGNGEMILKRTMSFVTVCRFIGAGSCSLNFPQSQNLTVTAELSSPLRSQSLSNQSLKSLTLENFAANMQKKNLRS